MPLSALARLSPVSCLLSSLPSSLPGSQAYWRRPALPPLSSSELQRAPPLRRRPPLPPPAFESAASAPRPAPRDSGRRREWKPRPGRGRRRERPARPPRTPAAELRPLFTFPERGGGEEQKLGGCDCHCHIPPAQFLPQNQNLVLEHCPSPHSQPLPPPPSNPSLAPWSPSQNSQLPGVQQNLF